MYNPPCSTSYLAACSWACSILGWTGAGSWRLSAVHCMQSPSNHHSTPPIRSATEIKALPEPVHVRIADSTQSMTAQQTRAYSKGTILGRLGSAPSVHQSSNGKEFYMCVSILGLGEDTRRGHTISPDLERRGAINVEGSPRTVSPSSLEQVQPRREPAAQEGRQWGDCAGRQRVPCPGH